MKITTTIVKTYQIKIYSGFRIQYSDLQFDVDKGMKIVEDICQQYCDEVGLCVTIDKTRFVYTNGNEDGVCVGLINYPRYPLSKTDLKSHAINIATLLKEKLQQNRVSIVCDDETIMIGDK